ncbi:MAG: sle [Mycobacterium sp.]|nr:sle [Mycobacterium sp.]
MCGRFASTRSSKDLSVLFGARDTTGDAPPPGPNVGPTRDVPVLVTPRASRAPEPEGLAPAAPEPTLDLVLARWGLVPSWAKDPGIAAKLINARWETAATKPAFRKAWRSRRCAVPVDGWYEWDGEVEWQGRPRRRPWFIGPPGGGVVCLAGLWELWRPPGEPGAAGEPAPWWTTFTVLTTDATDEVGRVHDRAPVLLPDESAVRAWIGSGVQGDPAAAAPGLAAPDYGALEVVPVSPLVNDVRVQEGDLTAPYWPPPGVPQQLELGAGPSAGPL